MSNALDTLKARYPEDFTESWNPQHRALTYGLDHSFIVYSGDTLHQNTIDDSNCFRIYGELAGEFPHEVNHNQRAYTQDIYVSVESLENNEELADRVLEILEALDDYPIYDESHYSELEHERIVEYTNDVLVWDIANALGMSDSAKVRQWVDDNLQAIWDHADGSVDDELFDTEALTELARGAL